MIRILTFETKKEPWFQSLCQKYEKKIKPFYPFERFVIKSKSTQKENKEDRLKKEAQSLLKHTKKHFVILCDEKGKSLNSRGFATFLKNTIEGQNREMDFIVGGAYGVSDEIKERADATINLSPFVLNHLIAQSLLMEQIYRAFSIWKGLPYHND